MPISPNNVIFAYRSVDPDSLAVAQAYQSAHNLNSAQLVPVPCSAIEILPDEELITSIDLNITQIMESDVEDITGMIQYFVVFPAEAVDEFDDAILHYEVSLPVQYTNEVDEGGIQYPFFLPIESFDETNEGDISYTLNPYNLTGYLDSYVNRQRNNTDRFRNLAKGTKNSSLTTTDRGPAVVLTASNPKKLIVNYADNPKLTVK